MYLFNFGHKKNPNGIYLSSMSIVLFVREIQGHIVTFDFIDLFQAELTKRILKREIF